MSNEEMTTTASLPRASTRLYCETVRVICGWEVQKGAVHDLLFSLRMRFLVQACASSCLDPWARAHARCAARAGRTRATVEIASTMPQLLDMQHDARQDGGPAQRALR